MRQVDDPDERITVPAPSACAGCDASLAEVPVSVVRRRQLFDLPEPPPPQVIEYAADIKRCPGCGEKAIGSFPAGVESAAPYGPGNTTKVADAVLGHHIPVHRSTLLVMELCGVKVSTGFAAGPRSGASRLLEDTFPPAVRALPTRAPLVHAERKRASA